MGTTSIRGIVRRLLVAARVFPVSAPTHFVPAVSKKMKSNGRSSAAFVRVLALLVTVPQTWAGPLQACSILRSTRQLLLCGCGEHVLGKPRPRDTSSPSIAYATAGRKRPREMSIALVVKTDKKTYVAGDTMIGSVSVHVDQVCMHVDLTASTSYTAKIIQRYCAEVDHEQ